MMKNMFKKMLAMFAALAVMVSVVMPCGAGGDDDEYIFEIWDEDAVTNRD